MVYVTDQPPRLGVVAEPMTDEWMADAVAAVLAAGGQIGANEYGTPVSLHVCRVCGDSYTVCPPSVSALRESLCLMPACASYDPARDAEVFFAPDDPDLVEGEAERG